MAGDLRYVFSSESVSEGHPDKVCDFIADSVLDACLEQDPKSRVACEVLCKNNIVVLAGEITTKAKLDYVQVAREAIRTIGYTDPTEAFNADGVFVNMTLTSQSPDIAQGVDEDTCTGDHSCIRLSGCPTLTRPRDRRRTT